MRGVGTSRAQFLIASGIFSVCSLNIHASKPGSRAHKVQRGGVCQTISRNNAQSLPLSLPLSLGRVYRAMLMDFPSVVGTAHIFLCKGRDRGRVMREQKPHGPISYAWHREERETAHHREPVRRMGRFFNGCHMRTGSTCAKGVCSRYYFRRPTSPEETQR